MRRLETLLLESAAKEPDAIAVIDGVSTWTYRELHALSNRIGHALIRLGVGPGDRVGIWLDKSALAIAAMQGALRIGAAYVPLDPLAPIARIQELALDAAFAAVVTTCDREARGLGGALASVPTLTTDGRGRALGWRDVLMLPDLPLPPLASPSDDDLAYILYTSGSTGTPKGVCIRHRNARAFIDWAHGELAPNARDRFSSHAPFHFDLSVLDLYVAFGAGASVVLIPEGLAYAASLLVAFVAERRITVWYSVPSALMLMMEQGGLCKRTDLELRIVLFAGEVFPIKPLRKLRRVLPQARLLNLYGPTETNVCTYHEVCELSDRDVNPVPIGKACSEDHAYALRSDGELAASGEEGELCVEGGTVMWGYFGREPLGDAPYRTGDIVRVREDGGFDFVGRRDHQVKVRGHRIELGAIEAVLLAAQEIADVAVLVRGEGMTARLCAYVVPSGAKRPSLLFLKALCAARLPRYMIVDDVVHLAVLPRTRNGKLDRRALALQAELPGAAP